MISQSFQRGITVINQNSVEYVLVIKDKTKVTYFL
jgi:hypothetical protein